MDDCLLVIRADKSDEKALYDRIAWGIKLLNKHAKRLGLNFANDKAQLLLPQDWVPPTAGLPEGLVVRSNTLLNVEQQGIEVVGCPVGSIDFRQTFVQRNLGDVLRSRDDLKQLHPQCATRLLLQCVSACPAYIAQVVHPSATKEALTTFDDNMWSFLLEFLGGIGGDNQLKCCPEGLSRARFRAQLPCRLGGAGLRSWERTADFAWFTSVASCVAESDPNLDVGRAHFGALAHIAYEAAIDSLGGTSHPKVTSGELIPGDDPDVLTVSNFYKELFMDYARVNKTPLRLQKEFSAVTAQNAADELLSKSEGAHVSDSERITLLSKSPIMSHLFTADLSNIETRLSKTEFIISVRHFLCLPSLRIYPDEPDRLMCGCEVESCDNSHCERATLDWAGNHALLCHKGLGAQKALLLELELERMFRKAGGSPDRQPSTRNLLGKVFDREELAALFPGGLSQASSNLRAGFAMEYLTALHTRPSRERDEKVARIKSLFPTTRSGATPKDIGGVIRFDLCLTGTQPTDAPRALYLDHAIVHETSDSYQVRVLRHLQAGRTACLSVPFKKAEGEKKGRFGGLIKVAERLAREGFLGFSPFFLFPVVSTLGCMNVDMTKLLNWIQERYKQSLLSSSERLDGVPKSVLVGKFGVYLERALCFALLRANALALHSQGRPDVLRP